MIHLARDGKQLGSFSIESLCAMAIAGDVMLSDHVYYQQIGEWKRISDLPELESVLFKKDDQIPPPPPATTIVETPEHLLDTSHAVVGQTNTSVGLVEDTGSPSLWSPAFSTYIGLFCNLLPASQYLHYRNWVEIGDKGMEEESKHWLGVSVIMSLIMGFLLLKSTPDWVLFVPVAFWAVWYFSSANKQIKFVKSKYGNGYTKKSPLLPIVAVLIAAVAGFVIITNFGPEENAGAQTKTQVERRESTPILDLATLTVEFERYAGTRIRFNATLMAAGGQVMLVPSMQNMGAMLLGNISRLPKETQATIYRNCGGGCNVVIDGVPVLSDYQKVIYVEAISDAQR